MNSVRIFEEFIELSTAVIATRAHGDGEWTDDAIKDVQHECADVANFCMMLSHNLNKLKEENK